MATLLTPLPTLAFPHEVDTLTLSSAAPVQLTLQLGDKPLLSTRLTPDGQSRVMIEQLAALLREHLTTSAADLRVMLDGALVGTVRLLPCRLDIGMTATAFLAQHFLSLSPALKTTHRTAREVVAWRGTETPSILASWLTSSSEVMATTFTPRTYTDATGLTTAELLPAQFSAPQPAAQLIDFTLTVGGRTMSFLLPPQGYGLRRPLDVEFTNAFGIRESFHFFGVVERSYKPTHTVASIGGKLRTLRVEEEELWKVGTGAMFHHDAQLLSDLVAARELWRRSDGVQLVVEECNFHDQQPAIEPQMATLTLREASVVRSFRPPSVERSHRVFDSSFDPSFE